MPETKPKKKPTRVPGANTQKLVDKLDELHETVMEIQEDVERIKPHSAFKRFLGHFAQGVLRGIGFVFGTTILAAVIVVALQQFFQSEKFQEWLGDAFITVLTPALESAVHDIIGATISNL